jgi:integrase/recombinase XerD
MNNSFAGPWVRRFLVEYVLGERNYSPNTQHSYRDTFRLFLPFVARKRRCALDRLTLRQITPKVLRQFLGHLEHDRQCSPATLNQRLAALRAWSRFVGLNSPEQLEWSRQIRTIHFKKQALAPMHYLEKDEIKALLAAPDRSQDQGFRDYALLLFLYNTGARASEAAHLAIGDLDLLRPSVTLHGKGRRDRRCPLWFVTATALRRLVMGRSTSEAVFASQRGGPLTRYGIHTLVERYARQITPTMPTLRTKRVSPHTLRHTTGMDLLRSGVDINTIRVWLGHVSLKTTNIYAESDLNMKAEALARCEAPLLPAGSKHAAPKGVMAFLNRI